MPYRMNGYELPAGNKEHPALLHSGVVWLTLITQVAFPLSLAFTPAVLAHASRTPLTSATLADTPVIPYTLKRNETVLTVANRYRMTVDELKQLNRLRTFSRPFEQLSAGDDIDVPEKMLSQDAALPAREKTVSGSGKSDDNTAEVMGWLSGNAAGLAGAMKTQGASDYVTGQARSAAVSGTQSAVQGWLNQFGTARIELGTRDDLSLSDSAVDFLLPVYDHGNVLVFTQSGWRYHDKRNTLNLGAGVRLFGDSTMYGINAFYDNDLTGSNRRLGLGGELWRDYLQFSVNGYMRLTNWHQSRDLDDYDERPASGFDLRARGWLPAYPQLGGELKYEQYFGDEVALISKDDRQKNPKAVSVGVNWTPFPLMTLSSDYRNSSGKSELQMQAQFTYVPGVAWAEQISAAAVGDRRMLTGSRQALVERNNNIILEYRKQELIRLTLPQAVSGPGSSLHTLNALLKSKYGVASIDWALPADFTAGGGVVTAQNGDLSVWQMQLPVWEPGALNAWVLSATAKDVKGNLSAPAYVQVTVEAPVVSDKHSTLTADAQTLTVMGGTQVTLMLRDAQNNPVTGLASRISLPFSFTPATTTASVKSAQSTAASAAGGVTLTALTETAPGTYTATLTAGPRPGTITLSPEVDGLRLRSLDVAVTAGAASDQTSSLEASPVQVPADGQTTSQLTLTLRDAQGNLLADDSAEVQAGITFSSGTAPGVTVSPVTRTGPGVFTASLSGTTPGAVTVQALVGSRPLTQQTLTLTPTAYQDNLSGAYLDMVMVSPQAVPADGVAQSEVTILVKGKDGQPLVNQALTVGRVSAARSISHHDVTTDTSGHFMLKLPPQTAAGKHLHVVVLNNSQLDVYAEHLPPPPGGLRIYRGGQEIQGHPIVGDTLTAVPDCQFASCAQPVAIQWKVEDSPGSGKFIAINGATGVTYTVTTDTQKRRLRVTLP